MCEMVGVVVGQMIRTGGKVSTRGTECSVTVSPPLRLPRAAASL